MPRTTKKIDETVVEKATDKLATDKLATDKLATDKLATATTEEPEVCSICYEEYNSVKKEMCMHEVQTSEKIIQHKCHETCGDQWIKRCVKNGITPFCPMCPTVKIQLKKKEIPVAKQTTSAYRATAIERFQRIDVNCPTLFGIMICIDNNYIKCYMNYNMQLNSNSLLSDIKQFILSESDEIYASTSAIVQSKIRFNLNYQNWKDWKYPRVRIADTHFAIPPYTQKIGLFHEGVLEDNATLGDLYIQYQTLAGEMYRHPPTTIRPNPTSGHTLGANIEYALSNIYMDKLVRREYPTGPDDPGHSTYAFINPENPVILTAHNVVRATRHSVSWIAVHLEYE
jgi:hypothetical protein